MIRTYRKIEILSRNVSVFQNKSDTRRLVRGEGTTKFSEPERRLLPPSTKEHVQDRRAGHVSNRLKVLRSPLAHLSGRYDRDKIYESLVLRDPVSSRDWSGVRSFRPSKAGCGTLTSGIGRHQICNTRIYKHEYISLLQLRRDELDSGE